jgi:hypothetical protein
MVTSEQLCECSLANCAKPSAAHQFSIEHLVHVERKRIIKIIITWHTSDPVPGFGFGEAVIAERADGKLLMNIRRDWAPRGMLKQQRLCRWSGTSAFAFVGSLSEHANLSIAEPCKQDSVQLGGKERKVTKLIQSTLPAFVTSWQDC